jgi:hypothetical protein
MFNKVFPENRPVYEIMWKKYGTARQVIDGNITRPKRFACWKTNDKVHCLKYTLKHNHCLKH